MVVATRPGTTVPLTIYRNKQRKTINITVGELDLEAEQNAGRSTRRDVDPGTPTSTDFGLRLEPLTPDITREAELPRGKGGALVSEAERDRAAAPGGVAPNDIILEVNHQPVATVAQATRALEGARPGTPVFLLVWRVTPRGGEEQFITMLKR